MLQRRISFNSHELTRVTTEALRGKSMCEIEKHPDGTHNKAMLLIMDDDTQGTC
jgi:hypothetical protein